MGNCNHRIATIVVGLKLVSPDWNYRRRIGTIVVWRARPPILNREGLLWKSGLLRIQRFSRTSRMPNSQNSQRAIMAFSRSFSEKCVGSIWGHFAGNVEDV